MAVNAGRSRSSVTPRHHFRHGLHRSARLRDHHSAAAVLRRIVRRDGVGDRPARHQLFPDAVPVLADLGTLVRSDRAQANHPDRFAGFVPVLRHHGAGDVAHPVVHRPHRRRHCRRQYSHRAGLHRRHHNAGGSCPRDGPRRSGLRPWIHIWSCDWRSPQPRVAETPMWFAAALCFANFVAAWFLLPESRVVNATTKTMGRMEAFRHAMGNPTLLLILALYFIVTMAFSAFEATFALFTEARFGYTAASIGLLFTFIGFIIALIQGVLIARVVKRVGERKIIPIAIAAIALSIGLLPFVWSVPTLLVALGLLAMGMGFNNPSLSSMVSKLSHEDDQGGTLGLASSLASLGRVVGPAWGGYMYDAFGMTTPYLSAAGLMFVAFLMSLVGLRSR